MPGRTRVRGVTLTTGLVLGGVLLVAMGVVGGLGRSDQAPIPEHDPAPAHAGPQTATQPELQDALLTGQDLPRTPATAGTVRPQPGPAAATTTPAPPPAPASPGETPVTELCRALLEEPAELPLRWGAVPPEETTAKHTTRGRRTVLHQVLSVFPAGRAAEAYEQLRETASACDEFSALLDGRPVTVLLDDLAGPGGRREAESFSRSVTVRGESGTLVGWLALDRVGPVVSVLHQLGPAPDPEATAGEGPDLFPGELPDELLRVRRSALAKLRPLLEPRSRE